MTAPSEPLSYRNAESSLYPTVWLFAFSLIIGGLLSAAVFMRRPIHDSLRQRVTSLYEVAKTYTDVVPALVLTLILWVYLPLFWWCLLAFNFTIYGFFYSVHLIVEGRAMILNFNRLPWIHRCEDGEVARGPWVQMEVVSLLRSVLEGTQCIHFIGNFPTSNTTSISLPQHQRPSYISPLTNSTTLPIPPRRRSRSRSSIIYHPCPTRPIKDPKGPIRPKRERRCTGPVQKRRGENSTICSWPASTPMAPATTPRNSSVCLSSM